MKLGAIVPEDQWDSPSINIVTGTQMRSGLASGAFRPQGVLGLFQTSWTITIWMSFSSVQLLSHVQLFVTPWTTARRASLSITNSQSLPKLMSIESVMPSNHLILCHPPLLLPSIFFSKWVNFSHEVAKVLEFQLPSVLPMNTQDWSPLGWTSWISLQSKGLWRVFSNTTVQKHQFFDA